MYRRDYRDIAGGGLLLLLGAWIAWYALGTLDMGTLRRMGPGLFPVGVGTILSVFGAAIMVPAFARRGTLEAVEIRSTICVLASLAVFGLLVRPYGLAPAIAGLIVTATLAETRFRPLSILASILVLSTAAYLIFSKGLGLPLVMARWPH